MSLLAQCVADPVAIVDLVVCAGLWLAVGWMAVVDEKQRSGP